MLDYLRILLNARLAKMDERGVRGRVRLAHRRHRGPHRRRRLAFGGVIKNIFSGTCKTVGTRPTRHLP